MKGEVIVLLELSLFYLLVAGAALWQLRDVSRPDKNQKADSKDRQAGN